MPAGRRRLSREEFERVLSEGMLTPAEVAAAMNCSIRHVTRLIESRALPAADLSAPDSERHLYRVSAEDLRAFLTRKATA